MFIEAKTRPELVKEMLRQNLSDNMSYRYFDIQWDSQKNVWVAWFYPENNKVHKMGVLTAQKGRVE